MAATLKHLGTIFYMVSPNETTFEHVEDVPNYTNEAVPLFIIFLILECVLARLQGESIRQSDFITSIMHGVIYDVIGIVFKGFMLYGYEWLYEHRLLDLDWTSPITWWIAALGVDLGYYWFHRATHEINLVWSSHQVHHSSEEYNLSTALRQSVLQRYFSLGIYQPLALLGVPLPALLVHLQFNLIYQFWIHVEFIGNLGPLEWVLNTPSHHRVHHGSNKWCLDKNYAGVLIIWDRIFGTFQAESKHEPIVYGLVAQPQTFNVVWLQFFYLRAVIRKARSMKTWGDTMKALFYGPGWFPGTPRLGDPDGLPDKTPPRPKYNPRLPQWQEYYVLIHFFVILIVEQSWVVKLKMLPWSSALLFTLFMFVSTGIIGAMYDGWWWAPLLEALRCLAFIAYARASPVTGNGILDTAILAYFAVSAFIWTSQSVAVVKATIKHSKLE